jgi:alpha-tubulin suppressor-like RCC1 family protein
MRHFAVCFASLWLVSCSGEEAPRPEPPDAGKLGCTGAELTDPVTGRCVAQLGETSICPADGFDTEHPWLNGTEVVFVADGGTGSGDERNPVGTLDAALDALPGGGVIVLSKGRYSVPAEVANDVTFVGSCAAEVVFEGLFNLSGGKVRMTGVNLSGGLKASGVEALTLHQVRIASVEGNGLVLSGVGSLSLSQSSLDSVAQNGLVINGETIELGMTGVDFLGPIGIDGIAIGNLGGSHHRWSIADSRFGDILGSAINMPDVGLVVPLADLDLRGNTFLGPIGIDGIAIGNLGGTHWVIESNQFGNLGGSAVRIAGQLTDLNVSKNEFLGPIGIDGIALGPIGIDGIATVAENTFAGIGARSIDVLQASGTLSLSANTITDSGWPAVAVSEIGEDGTLMINNNTLSGIDQIGISVEGSVGQVVLSGNVIVDVGVSEIGGGEVPPAMGFAVLVVDTTNLTACENTFERNQVGVLVDSSGWGKTYANPDLAGPYTLTLSDNTFVDQKREIAGQLADVVLQRLPDEATLTGDDIERSVNDTNGQPVDFYRNGNRPNYSGSLAVGGGHLCGVSAQHDLACRGKNESGQAAPGNGNLVYLPNAESTAVPGIATLAAGNEHTCVIATGTGDDNGVVYCAGDDDVGQRGAPDADGRIVQVTTGDGQVITGAAQIAAGANTTCVITGDGHLYCWGDPSEQVVIADRAGAQSITLISGARAVAVAVAVGGRHACAIANDKVWCWGDQSCGQLGNGIGSPRACDLDRPNRSSQPAAVDGLSDKPVGLALGTTHSCVLTEVGEVYCFGDNRRQQIGSADSPTLVNTINSPVDFPNNLTAKQIAAGGQHTCALSTRGGFVVCWGAGNHNQIGTRGIGGLATDSSQPFRIKAGVPGNYRLLTRVTALSLHGDTSCARKRDGTTVCWGIHSYFENVRETPTAEVVEGL